MLVAQTSSAASPALTAERIDEVVNLVVDGGDPTGIFYGQLHRDESLVPLIIAVSQRLLGRLDKLNEKQKRSALTFLCDSSLGPLKSCTPVDIRNRLDQLARKQRELERSQAEKTKR